MSNQSAACTIQEYRKNYARQEYYKKLKVNSIVAYVLCALNVVVSIAVNPWGLIDAVILLVCILGVHLGRIKGFAVALLVYSLVNIAIALMDGSGVGGWVWLLLGSSYLKLFKKIDEDYKLTMC